jgi:large subunit ribosomal protein L9
MDAVRAEAQNLADKVNYREVFIKVRVGEGDKLYGSVTSQHIVDALAELGVEGLDKKKLVLPDPIRSLGKHQIETRLHPDVSAEITVIVVPHTWKEGDPIPGTEEPEEGEVALEDAEETKPEAEAEEVTESAEIDEPGQQEEEPQA